MMLEMVMGTVTASCDGDADALRQSGLFGRSLCRILPWPGRIVCRSLKVVPCCFRGRAEVVASSCFTP